MKNEICKISIDIINMSEYLNRVLHSLDVKTIHDLININDDIVARTCETAGNVGNILLEYGIIKKCLELEEYKSGTSDKYDICKLNAKINRIKFPELCFSINMLDIPERAKKVFAKMNIKYVFEICTLNQKDFAQIKGIGSTTAASIISEMEYMKLRKSKNVYYDSDILDLGKELQDNGLLPYNIDKMLYRLNVIYAEKDFDEKFFLKRFFGDEEVKNIIADGIILECKKYESEKCDLDIILKKLPKSFKNNKDLEPIISGILKSHKFEIQGDFIKVHYPDIYEYSESLGSVRDGLIFLDRIKGVTLEEIGEKMDLTRERVRQIEARIIDKRPILREDKYKEIFKRYNFTKEAFSTITGEQETVYNYLKLCYGDINNKKNLEESLEDENISDEVRRKIEKYIYRDYIDLGGKLVKKDRSEITNYIIKNFAKNGINFKELTDLYNVFLEDLELDNEKEFCIGKGYENKISSSKYILWSMGKTLRYYDIESKDFDLFFSELSLENYHDVEISTLKLFREHGDLMKTYDIRDEYELHNLIKKICNKKDYPEMKICRMPTIKFGDSNRDKQVKELVVDLAPISTAKLAEEYEKKYGVLARTACNYFKCIDKYYSDGMFKIDVPIPSREMIEKITTLLSQDFYMKSDAVLIIKSSIKNFDEIYINPYTFKELGFLVYSDYIVKNIYRNGAEYFTLKLTESEIVDLDSFPKGMRYIGQFNSTLENLKSDYEIIEYAEHKYINISRLKKAGIEKTDLKEYCDYIYNNVANEYFTIYSLEKAGINHNLYWLGFDEWFYTSLLTESKEQFSCTRIGKNRLFRKGSIEVNWIDFIERIIYNQDELSIDIYELLDFLKNNYNLDFSYERIVYGIKESEMHYSKITEKIYAHYDIYFDAIE